MKPKLQSVQEIIEEELPEEEDLLGDGLLPVGGRLLIYGATKSFKSFLGQSLCFSLAAGQDWLGYKVWKPVRTLYIQAELPRRKIQKRTQLMRDNNWPEIKDQMHGVTARSFKLYSKEAWQDLTDWVVGCKAEFLLLDPLRNFLKGSVSNEEHIQIITDGLDYLVDEVMDHGLYLTVGLVHHSRKVLYAEGESIDAGVGEMRGSAGIGEWADSVIRVRRIMGLKATAELEWQAVRHEEMPPRQWLQFEPDRGILVPSAKDPRLVILELVKNGPVTVGEIGKELAEVCGLGGPGATAVRRGLVEDGALEEVRDGMDKRKVLVQLGGHSG